MSRVVFLGPQRRRPSVARAIDSIAPEGPVALITAGWQEDERNDAELKDHLGREGVNLELYAAAERVFRKDTELRSAWRRRQAELIERQELYNIRLSSAMEAARAILKRTNRDRALLDEAFEEAIEAVRALDGSHMKHLAEVHGRFIERYAPARRDAARKERRRIDGILKRSGAVAVAGGHVAVLLNRLDLFDLGGALREIPIVAWSAGAMALSEKVVLFHDHPPQGAGNAELLESGLAVCRGVVPLPHAAKRLALDDRERVLLLARRFAPDVCIPLDGGSRIDFDGGRLLSSENAPRLFVDGTVRSGAAA